MQIRLCTCWGYNLAFNSSWKNKCLCTDCSMNQKPFQEQKQHNIGPLMSSMTILAVLRIRNPFLSKLQNFGPVVSKNNIISALS